MKKIGIVGGLGPESTLYYYRTLIDLCRESENLRGNYPEIIIYSLNSKKMEQSFGSWTQVTAYLVSALESLYQAGADFGLIACNTAHIPFDDVKAKSPIPVLSIVEETCDEVAKHGLRKVGLFGSALTMRAYLYQDVFSKRDITIVVPKERDLAYIGEKISSELVLGIMSDNTRNSYLRIAERIRDEESIQGLILGCTEIPLLLTKVDAEKLRIPLFDTAKIHVQGAFRYCLSAKD